MCMLAPCNLANTIGNHRWLRTWKHNGHLTSRFASTTQPKNICSYARRNGALPTELLLHMHSFIINHSIVQHGHRAIITFATISIANIAKSEPWRRRWVSVIYCNGLLIGRPTCTWNKNNWKLWWIWAERQNSRTKQNVKMSLKLKSKSNWIRHIHFGQTHFPNDSILVRMHAADGHCKPNTQTHKHHWIEIKR